MKCIDDGLLRTRLDDELGADDTIAVDLHLRSCARCRGRMGVLTAAAGLIRSNLNELAPPPGEAPEDARIALARVRLRRSRSQITEPLWRRRVAVPVPAFALVILMMAMAAVMISRPWTQTGPGPRSIDEAPRAAAGSQVEPGIDLSTYDRGGRAMLIKIKRER